MRVIAGEARGVPLVAPPGRATRPTSDRLKEAIFSTLGDRGCRGRVLDLFAGSGALGIEALSRGAEWCDFVESSPQGCRAIEANLARTQLAGRARIYCLPVERFIALHAAGGAPYDLILLDPPYAYVGLESLLETLGATSLVGEQTTVLVEHASRRELPQALGALRLSRQRKHGDSAFSLYRLSTAP
jgi:16S rRNA (guanine966-N2)-methyltransferase